LVAAPPHCGIVVFAGCVVLREPTCHALVTGHEFIAEHCHVMQFLDGKIIRRTTYLDLAGYLENLQP